MAQFVYTLISPPGIHIERSHPNTLLDIAKEKNLKEFEILMNGNLLIWYDETDSNKNSKLSQTDEELASKRYKGFGKQSHTFQSESLKYKKSWDHGTKVKVKKTGERGIVVKDPGDYKDSENIFVKVSPTKGQPGSKQARMFSPDDLEIMENVIISKPKPKVITTGNERSVAGGLKGLISRMETMSFPEIKSEFLELLNDPQTHLSVMKARSYKNDLAKIMNKTRLMSFITNIFLKGDGLGLSESKKNFPHSLTSKEMKAAEKEPGFKKSDYKYDYLTFLWVKKIPGKSESLILHFNDFKSNEAYDEKDHYRGVKDLDEPRVRYYPTPGEASYTKSRGAQYFGLYLQDEASHVIIDKYGYEKGIKMWEATLDRGGAMFSVSAKIANEKMRMLQDLGLLSSYGTDYFKRSYWDIWNEWVKIQPGYKGPKIPKPIPTTSQKPSGPMPTVLMPPPPVSRVSTPVTPPAVVNPIPQVLPNPNLVKANTNPTLADLKRALDAGDIPEMKRIMKILNS